MTERNAEKVCIKEEWLGTHWDLLSNEYEGEVEVRKAKQARQFRMRQRRLMNCRGCRVEECVNHHVYYKVMRLGRKEEVKEKKKVRWEESENEEDSQE